MGCKIVFSKKLCKNRSNQPKKQGILPLIFQDKSDYDKIEAFDTISTININEFGPTNNIALSLNKPDGSTYTIKTIHTFSKNQISWFKADLL